MRSAIESAMACGKYSLLIAVVCLTPTAWCESDPPETGLLTGVGSAYSGPLTPDVFKEDKWTGALPPGFKIVQKLGSGGLANVFLAQDGNAKRSVFKITHAQDLGARNQLLNEREILTRVRDLGPGETIVYRDRASGTCALQMPFVSRAPGSDEPAMTLGDIIEKYENGTAHELPIGYRITRGNVEKWKRTLRSSVEQMHAKGIEHNDLHFRNLLARWDENGEPVLVPNDFGSGSGSGSGFVPDKWRAQIVVTKADLEGEDDAPFEADRHAIKVIEAYLDATVKGERPSEYLRVAGNTMRVPPSVARVLKAALGDHVEVNRSPLFGANLTARQQQMLCEANYSWLSHPRVDKTRGLVLVGK